MIIWEATNKATEVKQLVKQSNNKKTKPNRQINEGKCVAMKASEQTGLKKEPVMS